jgi:hypothetical protein
MNSPMDEPVAPALTEIAEASSGTRLRSAVLRHPVILAVDTALLRQVLTEFAASVGGGPLVTMAARHLAEVLEQLQNGGLASMTPEKWSGHPGSDWLMPVSLAQILDVVAARMYYAVHQPESVTPAELVEACRLAYNHAAMDEAPAIIRAGVGRDLAVALRSQLRTRPDAEAEREAARLESEARDHGIPV